MPLLLSIVLAGLLLQSSQAPGAVLAGRVLEDGSRAPIAGARVTLIPVRPDPRLGPFSDPAVVAVSNREGRFQFDGLDPGRYRVTVQKAGFATPQGLRPVEVALAPGQPPAALTLTMVKGAVITGRVVDESGEPLAELQVVAMTRPATPPNAPARPGFLIPSVSRVQTNDLGEFRLFSLPPGEYFVQAMPSGPSQFLGATILLPTYFPNASDPQSALPVSVTAGQTASNIVVQMIAVRAFMVSGTVRDNGGQPVVNAMVRVIANDAFASAPMTRVGLPQQTRSDSSGRFTVRGVASGNYTLLAVAPVVVSRGAAGGAAASGSVDFASGTIRGSVVGVSGADSVLTETRSDGTTTEYRDDRGVRVPIQVGNADVIGLDVTVP
jgi:protocatechuate 3,4-dioxygenase beta subunit